MRRTALACLISIAACGRGHGSNGAPLASIVVTARWPGHAPADAMAAVAVPFEDLIAQQAGIDHVIATCRDDGACVVTALVADGADAEAIAGDLGEGAKAVVRRLPADLETMPVIERRTRGAIMRVDVWDRGDDPATMRRKLDDALIPRIEATAGVGGVARCGGAAPRIVVAIDPARLGAYGLGVDDVVDAMGRATANVPAGDLDGPRRDYTLATGDDPAIGATLVSTEHGVPVRLGDLATITRDDLAAPCSPPVAADRAAIDVRVPAPLDEQRRIADAILAAAREDRVEIQIVHGPARYAIAMRDPADGVAARKLAAQWRNALFARGGVEIEPGPARTGVWTIDRDAVARVGVSNTAASLAVQVLAGHLRVGALETNGERIALELTSTDPDPEHVPVRGGAPHPVPLGDLARRADADDRAETFDRAPASIVRFSLVGDGHADADAADVVAAAQAAYPPPAGVTITSWREP